jgi:microcystin-dependent protein
MTTPLQPTTVHLYSTVPIPPRAASGIADAMASSTSQSNVLRRWGIVSAINTDGTVDVLVGGVNIPALKYHASYQPTIGERVMLDAVGTDMTVLGAIAPSVRNFNRPTGDIEATLRRTPKPDTLFLQGQTVNREDYPSLFNWAVQQGLMSTAQVPDNLFGNGDGSTTFTLPDFRGRVLMNADGTTPLGESVGTNQRTLTADVLPEHDHGVEIEPGGSHKHAVNIISGASGTHAGHSDYPNNIASNAGGGTGWTFPTSYNISRGSHTHSVAGDTETGDPHTHTLTQTPFGGGQPLDMRQASYAVNYLICV